MTRILVTGGAGYIGRHVMQAAAAAGFEACWLDRRPGDGPGLTVDMCDQDLLADAIGYLRPDVIIHLAAHSSVAESMREPGKYAENVGMCQNLAATAGRTPIVLASSAAVYGEGGEEAVPEWACLAPISPYGWSKLASEAALPQAMALRLFNVAGGDGDEGDHLVPRAAQARARGQALPVNGDGFSVRDYVHVKDVARAFVIAALALREGSPPRPINICTGVGRTVRQVATAAGVGVICGRERPGDVRHLVGDPREAHDLGWTIKHSFDEIIASALAANAICEPA